MGVRLTDLLVWHSWVRSYDDRMTLTSVDDERVGRARNLRRNLSSSEGLMERSSSLGGVRVHEASPDDKIGPSLASGQVEVGVHGIEPEAHGSITLETLHWTDQLAFGDVGVSNHQAWLLHDFPV